MKMMWYIWTIRVVQLYCSTDLLIVCSFTLVSYIYKRGTTITTSSAVTDIYVCFSTPSAQPSTTPQNSSVVSTTDAMTAEAHQELTESTSASNHTTAVDSAEKEATPPNEATGMISKLKSPIILATLLMASILEFVFVWDRLVTLAWKVCSMNLW